MWPSSCCCWCSLAVPAGRRLADHCRSRLVFGDQHHGRPTGDHHKCRTADHEGDHDHHRAAQAGGLGLHEHLAHGRGENNFLSTDGQTLALTHILITLDPDERVIKFTEFPYNLLLDVETENGVKAMPLQAVSSSFGEDMVVATLEKDFGIKIDHWVVMNMSGVADIVDAMGGIEIDIKSLSLNQAAVHIAALLGVPWEEVTETGPQVLTGVQAAGYFVDTVPQTGNVMKQEEVLFRDRHENLL